MIASAEYHSYRETGIFTPLVQDLLDDHSSLKSLHNGVPTIQNIRAAIQRREQCPVDRKLLVETLHQQYAEIRLDDISRKQIDSLLDPKTFTITTAHQCNLFLGPAYTIYKALHAIKLVDELNRSMSDHHFVPVFWLGSEDADLDELNHTYVHGKRWDWKTNQRGAVGRMKVDGEVISLIDGLEKELLQYQHGSQWIQMLRDSYAIGRTLAECCFRMLHALFADKGLIVIQPDDAKLKSLMGEVFWQELTKPVAQELVGLTDQQLTQAGYKPQAHARAINLFYLSDGVRARMEQVGTDWVADGTSLRWNATQLKSELVAHPERFSPNVILRGLYQESVLPNLVYVGGGGELAYWLQLKSLFDHYKVSYPLLQLRASFQWMDRQSQQQLATMRLTPAALFQPVDQILDARLDEAARQRTDLSSSMQDLKGIYEVLRVKAKLSDPTLEKHVLALQAKALKRLEELESKMKRAERRRMSELHFQIESLQHRLFPGGGLQERSENAAVHYARFGSAYFEQLYQSISVWEPRFAWVKEAY